MLNLQFFRSKAKGVSDLLNHQALIDLNPVVDEAGKPLLDKAGKVRRQGGGIVCKDGALIAGFFYRGEDSASSTNGRRNLISGRVNRALARLGNEYATFFEAVRMPVAAYSPREDSAFPDAISQLVDDARRERAMRGDEHFITEQVLTIKYMPPSKRQNWLTSQFFDGDVKKVGRDLDRHIEDFDKTLRQLEDDLSDVLTLRRMGPYVEEVAPGEFKTRDELLNYVNFTVGGSAPAINVPPTGMYLDVALGGNELFPGNYPRLGDKHIAVVAIEGFPAETWPGILDVLNHMAIPYRAVYRFIHLEQHTALALLKKNKLKWEQQIRPFMDQLLKNQSGRINEDALEMAREVAAAETDAHSALLSFGYATPTIILTDTDLGRLEENARIVAAEIAKDGFNTRIETVNALMAWLGSLPGHTAENIRRPLLHTLSWADLAPLSTVWPGAETNPNPLYPPNSPPLFVASTTGHTPFRMNCHSGDVGHTLILGPTGAGKSVLLAYIAMQARRYPGATITVFDKGASMQAAALACGGAYFDMTPDNSGAAKVCPLQYLETGADLAKASEFIETLYVCQFNQPLTPAQRGLVHDALVTLSHRPSGRSLTNFKLVVQDDNVREALHYYTLGGPLGDLMDADADAGDLVAENPFAVFETEELMSLGEKAVVPMLAYLFDLIERRLTGQPAFVILDEAWMMLAHPAFREKIKEWLKVFRKKNCVVIMATQSVADVQSSPIASAINESCPTKIFLPNPDAERSADLYAAMGLNEREIEILSQARKKRDYYVTQPEGRRLIYLDLDEVTLAFVTASDKEARTQIEMLRREHGEQWPYRWLDRRGVSYRHLLPQSEFQNAA